ncbi:MAG TPA: cyclopropane-fatty-acyl-phospholipid synthase family protein [Polyangiaceae bacterium]
MTALSKFVHFEDTALARRLEGKKLPMSTLFEAYLDGAIDIPDMDAFLDARRDLVDFTLTFEHVKQFVTRMLPEWTNHSLAQDTRIVRENYDRGDDFYAAFLGERMVYTSAIFLDSGQSLEEAQDTKLELVCRKVGLKPGDELLDVGCGWGTLALHAAERHGARATGVTLSRNQTEFGNARIERAGLRERARIQCCDYREMPQKTYDRIVSLEMVEHVGLKNLATFCQVIYERLADDGLFFLQFAGLRRGGGLGVPPVGMRPEDMIWGLFMNKYIFPGADASPPLSVMLRALEKAGFGIQSVENVSIHYSLTIRRWHENWQKNAALVKERYGERWYRLWHLFLAWSWRIGAQGNSECFQVVAHKNLDHFDRTVFLERASAPLLPRSTPPALTARASERVEHWP